MYVASLTLDVLFGDVHSLKGKRSLVRPLVAEIARRFPVSVAETGEHDLHRRAEIGIAVVSSEITHCQDVLDACERLVAARPELELLSTRRRWWGPDDD